MADKFIYRALAVLGFVVFVWALLPLKTFAYQKTDWTASGTTPNYYVSVDESIAPVHMYIPTGYSTAPNKTYNLVLIFQYTLSNVTGTGYRLTSHWSEFTLSVNGTLYHPYSQNNGWVAFNIIVDGYGSEILLNNYIHYKTTNVGSTSGYMAAFNYSIVSSSILINEVPNGNVVGAINQGNELIDENNQLQEDANEIAEDTNTTTKNIFQRITEFFSGFFDNITLTVRNIIVPTSAQLTEFLGRVNTWFSARLGFIWYPFDLAIRLVTALGGGTASSQFVIPALSLTMFGQTYSIWSQQTIDMDAFGIFQYVRVFTSFLLVSWTVTLAVKKWDEWIGGHTE